MFSGPSYRTICQEDGHWSHSLPKCYGKYYSGPCIDMSQEYEMFQPPALFPTCQMVTLLTEKLGQLLVITRVWQWPVCPSSSQATTPVWSVTTGPGPGWPGVSRPSARSCRTPPGTGWWSPPTWTTGWWASSSVGTDTC